MFVLYLYTTPLGPQCSGSISEVEFCFRPVEMAATDRLFTLVTLIPMGNAFRVVTRSNVDNAPTDVDTCNQFGAITRCCDTRRLEPVVEITQDSVYGIETTEPGSSRLLTFRDIRRPGRLLGLPPGVSYDVNATVPPPDPSASEILVAMVRFIDIGKLTIQHLYVCKHHTVFIEYTLAGGGGGGGGERELICGA